MVELEKTITCLVKGLMLPLFPHHFTIVVTSQVEIPTPTLLSYYIRVIILKKKKREIKK